MKTWQLSLLAAAAAFGLQACDVDVRPGAQGSASSETVLSSPAPQDATPAAPTAALPADGSAPMVAGAPAGDGAALPSDSASATADAPLPAPDTGAMGAAGMPAMPAAADGVAAPTELARFLEENPVAPRKADTASKPSDDGKASAGKSDDQGSAAQGSKS